MILPDKIIRSSRSTMSLSIGSDGLIIVRAPSRLTDEQIKKFVSQKQNWLALKLSQIKSQQYKFANIREYKSFLLYGNKYELQLADVKKPEASSHAIILPKKTEENKIMATLIQFFKKKAKEVLLKRTAYLKSIVRIEPKSVKLTNSKGRWGSCNTRSEITLNWRVIMLPPECIDYVIIHELCHLIEMNHSNRFWNFVQTFMPNSTDARNQLKEYSFLLELYR